MRRNRHVETVVQQTVNNLNMYGIFIPFGAKISTVREVHTVLYCGGLQRYKPLSPDISKTE